MKSRHGFTLIELLIVVVIIGILAAIAIPKYTSTKEKAYISRLKSDLRNVSMAQENYFYSHSAYANDIALLTAFTPSQGTTITIVEGTASGWSAKATSAETSVECVLVYGATMIAPATSDGSVTCTN